jgi:hypothetical protein
VFKWSHDQPLDHGHILTDFTYHTHDILEHMLYQWQETTVYCTPDDGCEKYPKHVEWSCNKTKIIALHLVGTFYMHIHCDARNHERKIVSSSSSVI